MRKDSINSIVAAKDRESELSTQSLKTGIANLRYCLFEEGSEGLEIGVIGITFRRGLNLNSAFQTLYCSLRTNFATQAGEARLADALKLASGCLAHSTVQAVAFDHFATTWRIGMAICICTSAWAGGRKCEV